MYTRGEFRGEPGVVLIALCWCGLTSVVPLSVSPRRAGCDAGEVEGWDIFEEDLVEEEPTHGEG